MCDRDDMIEIVAWRKSKCKLVTLAPQRTFQSEEPVRRANHATKSAIARGCHRNCASMSHARVGKVVSYMLHFTICRGKLCAPIV